ncbi:MAG: amidohydrolase, partial [Firmicutes bacterium]|nr:amidohydrolase [Bacillota bacterium]
MLTQEIKAKAEEFTPALIEFRRDLHMHPELSNEESRTAEKIAEQLSKIDGMEVITGAAGTGVVGILRGTAPEGTGKTVLLRADIDALPVQETTGLEFASQTPNVMHACGHDGHASWLLGSAMILGALKDRFSGTVKFVFQPAEEGGGGGRRMVEQFHVLEDPAPDAVFACHAWPDEEEG